MGHRLATATAPPPRRWSRAPAAGWRSRPGSRPCARWAATARSPGLGRRLDQRPRPETRAGQPRLLRRPRLRTRPPALRDGGPGHRLHRARRQRRRGRPADRRLRRYAGPPDHCAHRLRHRPGRPPAGRCQHRLLRAPVRAGAGIPVASGLGDRYYTRLSGTSASAAQVAGVAATYLHDHPDTSATDLDAALARAATPDRVQDPGAESRNLLAYVGPTDAATGRGAVPADRAGAPEARTGQR